MNCPDQELCREIIPYLSAIQQGEEPEEFPVATREEVGGLFLPRGVETDCKTP